MRYVFFIAALLLVSRSLGQEIVEIPPLPGEAEFVIVDVANNGSAILGKSWDGTIGAGISLALWRPDTGSWPLPHVFGREALDANAISADGSTVVGVAVDPDNGHLVAVRWSIGGEVTIIRPPAGHGDIVAFDSNADGSTVIGRVRVPDGSDRGFSWSETTGVVVLQQPPGFETSFASAVDEAGHNIVGFAQAPGGRAVPCLWNIDGEPEVLPMPNDVEYAIGKGISGDGSRVIGEFTDAVSTYFAYVWDRDQGFLDLGLRGDTTAVTSMSYDGRIVAWGPGERGRIYDDSVGLIDIRYYLEARGLARHLPDFFGISHISPDGSTLAMAYVEGVDERYVSAIITNFSLPTNCPPDIDLNEQLDIFDFMAFINRFNSGDPRADLDGDGVLTIGDFLAYQTAFDAGC